MVARPIGQEQFVCHRPDGLGSELGLDLFDQLKSYVDQKYTAVVSDIRAKVKTEVLEQIPTIRATVTREVMSNVPEIRSQVRQEATSAVKPLLIAAYVIGGLGLAGAIVALVKLKKRRGR
jgi:hypothetical protein